MEQASAMQRTGQTAGCCVHGQLGFLPSPPLLLFRSPFWSRKPPPLQPSPEHRDAAAPPPAQNPASALWAGCLPGSKDLVV